MGAHRITFEGGARTDERRGVLGVHGDAVDAAQAFLLPRKRAS
jgi:hypothetical protein